MSNEKRPQAELHKSKHDNFGKHPGKYSVPMGLDLGVVAPWTARAMWTETGGSGSNGAGYFFKFIPIDLNTDASASGVGAFASSSTNITWGRYTEATTAASVQQVVYPPERAVLNTLFSKALVTTASIRVRNTTQPLNQQGLVYVGYIPDVTIDTADCYDNGTNSYLFLGDTANSANGMGNVGTFAELRRYTHATTILASKCSGDHASVHYHAATTQQREKRAIGRAIFQDYTTAAAHATALAKRPLFPSGGFFIAGEGVSTNTFSVELVMHGYGDVYPHSTTVLPAKPVSNDYGAFHIPGRNRQVVAEPNAQTLSIPKGLGSGQAKTLLSLFKFVKNTTNKMNATQGVPGFTNWHSTRPRLRRRRRRRPQKQ